MPRIFILFTLVSALGAGRLCAQAVPARSADYLFLATASDARATWVNPAGPATAPTASIAAELVFDRQETENVRLAQWTGGFSSRGISFGYQRDQIPGDEANQAFRVGAALPFRRGAVGLAFTFYDSDQTERALDLGLRYRALRQVELGAVLRNIGRDAHSRATGAIRERCNVPPRRTDHCPHPSARRCLRRLRIEGKWRGGPLGRRDPPGRSVSRAARRLRCRLRQC